MEKRKDEREDKTEEIKHSNVEDSIEQYFLDKIAKNEKTLSIDEVLAKMQMHVDFEKLKDEKRREGDREL